MSKTFLLAGGTGLIGTRLTTLLRSNGHTVRLLTRTPRGADQFAWDPAQGTIDDKAVAGADVVINLAGAGIADGRWTSSRRKQIVDSRVQSAGLLRDTFRRLDYRPALYISASAIGYYGNSGEQLMHEADIPVHGGFLVDTCKAWEQAAAEVAALGIPTTIFRIGVVLAREGGALPEIVKTLRVGIGTYFADGQAWYSWIHADDLCRMFLARSEQPSAGPEGVPEVFNAVAPNPVRNLALVKAATKGLHQPAIFVPAPAFALRVVLGDMSAVVLDSIRVSADKILQTGFVFQYPEVEGAMKEIYA